MLNQPLAIVDVETTGLSPAWDRVIELCVLRVENGKIIGKLDTLINPQVPISPFIESMTGIRREDLEGAPLFLELREQIAEILDGATFVAHNVNFDYSFIRRELKRLDVKYSAQTLCTVRLSRTLYPQARGHSLASLIDRFGFSYSRRHRAYDDAHILYQFLSMIQQNFPKERLTNKITLAMKNTYSFNKKLGISIDDLPETSGVYVMYDKNEVPLYVGKSLNVRERVKSHLTPTVKSPGELAILKDLARVEYIKTAGELGALLTEAEKIKELQPTYNRRLRRSKKYVVLRKKHVSPNNIPKNGWRDSRASHKRAVNRALVGKEERQDPWQPGETQNIPLTLAPEIIESFDNVNFEDILAVYKSQRSAREALDALTKKYELCPKYMGLDQSKRGCFAYKLDKCRGVCVGRESIAKYNARFLIAFIENKEFRPWMYDGPIEITEQNHDEDIYESFTINRWQVVKRVSNDYEFVLDPDTPFDLDVYKILSSYLRNKNIRVSRGSREKGKQD